MILKKLPAILLSLLLTIPSFSQELGIVNSIGSTYTFDSEILGRPQEIQVYLPEGYETDQSKRYPVLYLLDGQNWFTVGVSVSKVFTGRETGYQTMPDFIVVGIKTDWDTRRTFFGSDNTNNAVDFMKNELISFVDQNLRTSTEKVLFGWQFAGGFVMNTLATEPELFNGYLAATPVFYDPSRIDSLFSQNKDLMGYLFVTGSKEEKGTWVAPTVQILEDKAPKSFQWSYKEISAFGAFGHRISPVESITYGMRSYYSDYPILEFRNVQDFREKGGLAFVNSHYVKRAEKYGLSEEIPQWGMYVLVRMALREDDFSTFDLLMSEFSNRGFVENLRPWQSFTCAEVYLDNNHPDKAIGIYELIVRNDPDNARACNGLGKAYAQKNEQKQAKRFLKRAVELAEKSGDENLSKYKSDLEELRK